MYNNNEKRGNKVNKRKEGYVEEKGKGKLCNFIISKIKEIFFIKNKVFTKGDLHGSNLHRK